MALENVGPEEVYYCGRDIYTMTSPELRSALREMAKLMSADLKYAQRRARTFETADEREYREALKVVADRDSLA